MGRASDQASLARPEIRYSRVNLDLFPAKESLYPLSPDEIERSARFRFERHRQRFVAGRSYLRQTLAHLLSVKPDSIRFTYSEYGKPSVDILHSGAQSPLFFNLSHCEELMVLAISRSIEIGIDVEKVRKLPDEEQLVDQFFEKREREEYHALPEALKTQGFFNCWTRKEAFLKARGDGLQTPLDSFSVSLDPRLECRIRKFNSLPESIDDWTLKTIDCGNDAIVAIAAKTKVTTLQLFSNSDEQSFEEF
ncbi:4'-phosphopantetheinyl transferase superfamily [Verrucomicrobiia bacterium DG1235]|nr:4'-phosphopantetheinyl transferase superfamily [Verrucomicrobiae bacterium DG1235]